MSGYMTMAEIETKYPNEWVLVDKLSKGRDGFALGGTVVAHGTERDSVYQVAETLPVPRDVAIFYTGPIPEDALFVL